MNLELIKKVAAPVTCQESAHDFMRAHQYLYYVKCFPVLSDYDYDLFCKRNGLDGGGGSDRASDYPQHIIDLAEKL